MKKMDLKTKGFQNSLTQPRLSTLLALLSAPKLVRISRMSRRLKAELHEMSERGEGSRGKGRRRECGKGGGQWCVDWGHADGGGGRETNT